MAAHLFHKIRWDFMVDYHRVHLDPGITFPVGECGRIHAKKKKHLIQVEMRNYITDDMICGDEDCPTTSERTFRKTDKTKLFVRRCERGHRSVSENLFVEPPVDRKLSMFVDSLYEAIHEFASTELTTPAKPVEYYEIDKSKLSLNSCNDCNEFIRCLEFGDKQKLFELSDSELSRRLECRSPNPGIGRMLPHVIRRILTFYIYSNMIVYLDLRKESEWPYFMRPGSYFRREILYSHDGQTFIPHSRHLLANAMIDLNDTRELSKRIFRTLYFYVMLRLKLDSSYKLKDEFPYSWFRFG